SFAGSARLPALDDLDVEVVRRHVQTPVLSTLGGDHHHLAAAVAVEDRGPEDFLDERALVVVELLRAADDTRRAVQAQPGLLTEARELVDGIRVADHHPWTEAVILLHHPRDPLRRKLEAVDDGAPQAHVMELLLQPRPATLRQ